MRGHHPKTTGWAMLKLEIAWIRLKWEIARDLGLAWFFKIPPRRKR